jgi:hypothetical protein
MKKFAITQDIEGFWIAVQTLRYIQEGAIEAFASIVKSKLPDNINTCIIHGCEVTPSGGNTYTYTAGAIYHNGEIYQVSAASIVSATVPQWHQSLPVPAFNGNVSLPDGSTVLAEADFRIQLKSATGGIAKYNEIYRISQIEMWQNYDIEDIRIVKSLDLVNDFDTNGVGKKYTKWAGFALANGQGGRLDARGRFLVGIGQRTVLQPGEANQDYVIGDIGGEQNHLLLQRESGVRGHDHAALIAFPGGPIAPQNWAQINVQNVGSTTYPLSPSRQSLVMPLSAGVEESTNALDRHENRPPFLAVGYLVKESVMPV